MMGIFYNDNLVLLQSYKKNLVLFMVLYIFLAFSTDMPFLLYALIFMLGFFSLSSFAFDEHNHFDAFVRTLPVSPAQVIGSKYLLGLTWLAIGTAPAAAALAVMHSMKGSPTPAEAISGCLSVWMIMLLSFSVTAPLSIKMGSTKARNGIMVAWVALFGFIFLVVKLFPQLQAPFASLNELSDAQGLLVLLCLCGAALSVYAISFFVSLKFYNNKEF